MSRAILQKGTAACAAVLLLANAAPAQTRADGVQDYPNRPVRLVVPSAPGGGTDIIARIIAQSVGEGWGETVVVDNRGGGGGTVGMGIVARASPDGYTMGLGSVGHLTFSPIVRPGLPYDPQKDLAPISLAAVQPFLVAVSPSLPVKSIKDLIALAKAKPGAIKYGSGGVGAASHVGVALLELQADIKMLHVSYKGSNPAVTAVIGGEIDVALAGLATILPHAKAGRVRPLAVTGSKRAQIAPEIPTVAESGAPGYAFDVWYGLVFTGGTPPAIIAKANAQVRERLMSPQVNALFLKVGVEPQTSTSEEFKARIATEIATWRKVVKAANIKVQ
ncbi:MAG TPA: tripartite tricarboxylate transporter substrate binding protein [Burkholderiales bacterium]|nr:tripartite tricarboxylate transporter substrate binding protein [Burkholderiales bacterium]